ncbi:hypothetical protein APHAL10511_008584 [Amanita phalloides]|nr:hypothetical protein APHAL10511_008584 [Amanita phalloides]
MTLFSDLSTELQNNDSLLSINFHTNSETDRTTIALQHGENSGSVDVPFGFPGDSTSLDGYRPVEAAAAPGSSASPSGPTVTNSHMTERIFDMPTELQYTFLSVAHTQIHHDHGQVNGIHEQTVWPFLPNTPPVYPQYDHGQVNGTYNQSFLPNTLSVYDHAQVNGTYKQTDQPFLPNTPSVYHQYDHGQVYGTYKQTDRSFLPNTPSVYDHGQVYDTYKQTDQLFLPNTPLVYPQYDHGQIYGTYEQTDQLFLPNTPSVYPQYDHGQVYGTYEQTDQSFLPNTPSVYDHGQVYGTYEQTDQLFLPNTPSVYPQYDHGQVYGTYKQTVQSFLLNAPLVYTQYEDRQVNGGPYEHTIQQNAQHIHNISKGPRRQGTRREKNSDRHQNSGMGDHLCDICPKAFSGPYEADRHWRERHDGQRFLCRLCDGSKYFTRKENIKKHLSQKHMVKGQDADIYMIQVKIRI